MKKILLVLICVLIIAPSALILSACGKPAVYDITVLSSDARYGLVLGGGQFTEGDSTTISAKPKTTDTKFLCWTVNNKVVSASPDYTFTVNDENHGSYVAIFDQGCEYFVLTDAKLEVFTDLKSIEGLDLQIHAGQSLSSLQTLTNTSTNPYESYQNSAIANFHTGYIIHKQLDNTNPYYCKINAIVSTGKEENPTKSFEENLILDIDTLIDTGSLETYVTVKGFGTITMNFERLTSEHVKSILKIEN